MDSSKEYEHAVVRAGKAFTPVMFCGPPFFKIDLSACVNGNRRGEQKEAGSCKGRLLPFATMQFENIGRISLGVHATPLEEMPRLRAVLGANCPRLLIKRDDYTGFGLGGNKVRKIEYALAPEIQAGTTTIITIGGEKSNHARVTAAACAKLGLKCILVLNRTSEPAANERIPASRFAYEMFGAELFWVKRREDRDRTAVALAQSLIESGERAAYLPLGLSNPIGAVGFVAAFREMENQCEDFGVRPDYIFHSSSSGGTQAGLVYGANTAGSSPPRIVGVSPDDPADEIVNKVASITRGIGSILSDSHLPSIRTADVTVLDSYIGGGYGVPTPESAEAENLFALCEGILLDPLYTAKAAAAMIDWIRQERFNPEQTILFWHTGGQLAHFYATAATGVDNSGDSK